MHPIVTFAALSWTVALSAIAIIREAALVLLGHLTYREGSPTIALAFLCLVTASEAFAFALRRLK